MNENCSTCGGGCTPGNISKKSGQTSHDMGSSREVLEITVPEMDCSGEVSTISTAMEKLPGIIESDYYPVNRKIRFTIDPAKITPGRILSVIKELGMSPRADLPGKQSHFEGSRLYLFTTITAVLLFAASFAVGMSQGREPAVKTLLLLSMISGGWSIFRRGFYSLKNLNFDMNVLMSIAVIGAVYLGEFIEAAVVVILFSVAHLLEDYTIDKARRAIRNLMDTTPKTARLEEDGKFIMIPSESVKPGQLIRVNSNERIPSDGEVIRGISSVNQAPITGESVPVDKAPGDKVFAGTINRQGTLTIRVTHPFYDTQIVRIVKMVEQAQSRKAPAQNFVDRFAKVYTPIVIATAVLITLVPVAFFQMDFSIMFYRSMVLLLIACPCALVISTPVTVISGLSRTAGEGVLIKGGIHLENLASVDTFAFDKTGTLTRGELQVNQVIDFAGDTPDRILAIAASVESASEHPIARAIVESAKNREIHIPEADDFESITGAGARAVVNGREYFVGRHSHLCNEVSCKPPIHEKILSMEEEGRTVAVISEPSGIIGAVSISDTLRTSSGEALKTLRELGIKQMVMLTGDNRRTAEQIARRLGIDFMAELLPEQKVEQVEKMVRAGKKVAMVGDGVNDAPALSSASIGIAMGAAGSDTALEVADMALLSNRLDRIPFAVKISRKTLKIIKQNIILSVGIKGVFLILGILGLANLWMAVFADVGSSLIVILNGLRLLRFKG